MFTFEDAVQIVRAAAECRYCGRLIADLESAPRDSMGAYCAECEISDAVDIALLDATGDDEGRPCAATFLRHLAREGFAVVKVRHD